MSLFRFKRKSAILLTAALLTTLISYLGITPTTVESALSTSLVTLKASTGNYITDTSGVITAAATSITSNERFEIVEHGSNVVSIKSVATGRYLSYSDTSKALTSVTKSTLSALSATEKFTRSANADGTFSFLTTNKLKEASCSRNCPTDFKNLTATNKKLYVNATRTSNADQKFTVEATKITSILEITESGVSDINALFSSDPLIQITTYSMKELNASREYLDGKYDGIYIGKGSYSTTLLSKQVRNSAAQKTNHNTSAIQNDITNLKAKEIVEQFINKGQLVILYDGTKSLLTQAASNGKAGILRTTFEPYKTTDGKKENVVFVTDNDLKSSSAFTSKTKLSEKGSIRPLMQLTASPINYTDNPSNKYVKGNTLTYSFETLKSWNLSTKPLLANLYIGLDGALSYGADQVVASKEITTTKNTISYTLPSGYSGLRYWRLELIDPITKLKDISEGVIQFQDQKVFIKALQIMPNNSTKSSLNSTKNLNLPLRTAAYDITIDTTTISSFNSTGYKTINNKYDMLIFGFADDYNSTAIIGDAAANAVNAFINTGQSVMFTHDTIHNAPNSSSSSNWLKHFTEPTGQIAPQTDLGIDGVLPSTTAAQVNSGLLTQYPYNLSSSTVKISETHNQYFTLNLEDPTIIPWYNISGGSRPGGDSWNHYYTYSKGNVTYSGSGHTDTGFEAWEQQLFLNTIYRAYTGSNHAPVITANLPNEYSSATNNFIPSYSNIDINYQVDDFDLLDQNLITSVKFIYGNTVKNILTDKNILTGETVDLSIENPLPNGGDLTVEITASDLQGAEVKKIINVKVQVVESNLELTRTPTTAITNNQVAKGTPVSLTYTINPKNITTTASSTIAIDAISFSETFPPNMDVAVESGATLTRTGSLATGYTLSGKLSNISYKLLSQSGTGNKKTYIYSANPVSFKIKVTPIENGTYTLANSKLTFKDYNTTSNRTLPFPSYILKSVTLLTDLNIDDANILVADERKLIPTFKPADASNTTFVWTTENASIVTVNSNGVIKGIAPGTTKVWVNSTDGSGKKDYATITVIKPGLYLTGPSYIELGTTGTYSASLITSDYEKLEAINWSIVGTNGLVEWVGTDVLTGLKSTHELKGKKSGTVTIKANAVVLNTLTNVRRNYFEELPVTINTVTLAFPRPIQLKQGEVVQLWNHLSSTPASGKTNISSSLVWTSANNALIAIDSSTGEITASNTGIGTTTVTVTYSEDPTIKATVTVIVTKNTSPIDPEDGGGTGGNGGKDKY